MPTPAVLFTGLLAPEGALAAILALTGARVVAGDRPDHDHTCPAHPFTDGRYRHIDPACRDTYVRPHVQCDRAVVA